LALDIPLEWKVYPDRRGTHHHYRRSTSVITKTLKIREIHCEGCENTIRSGLSILPGVVQVVPSFERNDVRVSFDDATISEAELRHHLEELGYDSLS
jgi:copper chaperone CopZ